MSTFLHKGPKTFLLPAVAFSELSERGLFTRTHPVRISAQINTFHFGSHSKRMQRQTFGKNRQEAPSDLFSSRDTSNFKLGFELGFLDSLWKCVPEDY